MFCASCNLQGYQGAKLAAAGSWSSNTPQKVIDLLVWIAMTGAGDCQNTVLGRDGWLLNLGEHKMRPAGLWYATNRAGAFFYEITGQRPKGSMPPKPQGASCGCASMFLLGGGLLLLVPVKELARDIV